MCACPTVISSVFDKSFHFPSTYFLRERGDFHFEQAECEDLYLIPDWVMWLMLRFRTTHTGMKIKMDVTYQNVGTVADLRWEAGEE